MTSQESSQARLYQLTSQVQARATSASARVSYLRAVSGPGEQLLVPLEDAGLVGELVELLPVLPRPRPVPVQEAQRVTPQRLRHRAEL